MKAPKFWFKPSSWQASLLAPLAWIYGKVVAWRLSRRPHKFPVPIICVGNIALGGGGKTPAVLALVAAFQKLGLDPHVVSRGYKGSQKAPKRVDPLGDSSALVGDEPLLHARQAPTWVGCDRKATIQRAVAAGASLIIMDDGFQNPTIHKDFSLLVLKKGEDFGNGRIFPAGPLREDQKKAMDRADAVLVWGGTSLVEPYFAATQQLMIPEKLLGQKLLAFSGIAFPKRFYDAIVDQGVTLAGSVSFPDHHTFSPKEIVTLRKIAQAEGAVLVTTEKDFVRLPADFQGQVTPLSLSLSLDPGLVPFILKRLKLS